MRTCNQGNNAVLFFIILANIANNTPDVSKDEGKQLLKCSWVECELMLLFFCLLFLSIMAISTKIKPSTDIIWLNIFIFENLSNRNKSTTLKGYIWTYMFITVLFVVAELETKGYGWMNQDLFGILCNYLPVKEWSISYIYSFNHDLLCS